MMHEWKIAPGVRVMVNSGFESKGFGTVEPQGFNTVFCNVRWDSGAVSCEHLNQLVRA